MITERVNQFLSAIFDLNDPIYKSLIANFEGISSTKILTPADFNEGAMSDLLEYNRELTAGLLKQIYFDQSHGSFLNMIINNHIGISRGNGESDDEYKKRTTDCLFSPKISPAAIKFLLRDYSTPNPPEIVEGEGVFCYSDSSYSDVYKKFKARGETYLTGSWVYSAITHYNVTAYLIIVILYNTPVQKLPVVIDIIKRSIAAGIDFQIEVFS